MDTISSSQRSWNMSRIKSKHTAPELKARRILTDLGIRYRLHVKDLPGKPDITIKNERLAYFINGCFWHQHERCKKKSTPKSNIDYWSKKLYNNVVRQKKNIASIKTRGWNVKVIWECEVKNEAKLLKKLTI